MAHRAALISVLVALSLHCETTNTGLVHRMVCLFTPQPQGRYGIKLYHDLGPMTLKLKPWPRYSIYMYWMTWPSNFILGFGDTFLKYLGHSSVSRLRVQGQGHGSEKAVAWNSKTTGRKLPGLDQNICYDNTRSNLELLTFWLWHLTLKHIFAFFNSRIQALRSKFWIP